MQVIPSFNSASSSGFRAAYALVAPFMSRGSWIHVDYGRPPFAARKSVPDWNLVRKASARHNFEVHIMFVPRKGEYEKLFSLPCKRFFFHCDAVADWEYVRAGARAYGKELGCVIHGVDEIVLVPRWIRQVLVLAVTPGLSGQHMDSAALRTVRFLKRKVPNATITFDGGIDARSAARVRAAGADRIISSSYILTSPDPAGAYERLRKI